MHNFLKHLLKMKANLRPDEMACLLVFYIKYQVMAEYLVLQYVENLQPLSGPMTLLVLQWNAARCGGTRL